MERHRRIERSRRTKSERIKEKGNIEKKMETGKVESQGAFMYQNNPGIYGAQQC